jgi:hypothetical protein
MSSDRDSSRRRATGAKADRILEQALTHELRTASAPVTAACLDAETLAAWNDGGLDETAMAMAETHISSCPRCQAMLGTMMRGAPHPAAGEANQRGAFSLWRWWLAPIAAGAAAVTIWMVVPEQQPIAQAPPGIAQPSTEAVVAQAPASEAPREQAQGREQAQNKAADTVAALPQPAAREDRSRQASEAFARKEDEAKPLQESTAAAQPPVASLTAPAAPPPAAAPMAQRDAAEAPSPALQKGARLASAPLEIVSPDPLSRWRVVATGIERSEDGGLSWIPIRPPTGDVLTGGMSTARNIAWMIGRAGVVLVTVDGSTFARVDLPERVDITSIAALDARSASVTTVDGRTFRTGDSGRNWRQN